MSKVRPHVDSRAASYAKVLAKAAQQDQNLRDAILTVASSCCQLVGQMHSLVGACKIASIAFEHAEDRVVRDTSAELFEHVANTVRNSVTGELEETLEIVLVAAIEAMDNPAGVRALSAMAQSLGLDTSGICVDGAGPEDTSEPAPAPVEIKAMPASRHKAKLTDNHVLAIATAASTRGVLALAVQPTEGGFHVLGKTSTFDCRLVTVAEREEAERVAGRVRNILRRRTRKASLWTTTP